MLIYYSIRRDRHHTYTLISKRSWSSLFMRLIIWSQWKNHTAPILWYLRLEASERTTPHLFLDISDWKPVNQPHHTYSLISQIGSQWSNHTTPILWYLRLEASEAYHFTPNLIRNKKIVVTSTLPQMLKVITSRT